MKPIRPVLAAVVITLALAPVSEAQTLITEAGIAYTEDFNTFAGTEITLPSKFVFTPSVAGLSYNGYYNLSDAYVNSNRVLALRQNASASDVAFGLKASSSGNSTLDWTFQNASGSAIASFEIEWDFLQYSESGRANSLSLQYSLDGTTFTTVGFVGDFSSSASTRPPGTPPGAMNLAEAYREAKSITLLLPEFLEENEQITFRWNFAPGPQYGDSNNHAHIGVDNLRITAAAIPEPKTYLLLGAGVAALLLRRSRKEA